MTKEEKAMHKSNKINEINRLIKRMIFFENNKNFSKLISADKDLNLLSKVKKHPLFLTTSKLCNKIEDRFLIFQILYAEKFQKMYLKNNFIKTSYPKCKIDLVDFIYILNNKSNSKNIIKLFYNKLVNILVSSNADYQF